MRTSAHSPDRGGSGGWNLIMLTLLNKVLGPGSLVMRRKITQNPLPVVCIYNGGKFVGGPFVVVIPATKSQNYECFTNAR